ncbi:MAG TPA: TIGR03435 family protein [Bryobacteraceae bacterium]|nr:TIGR03435 family protein [Bryobacteraceae bacterium]
MIPDSLSPIANHLWQSTLFAGAAGLLTLILRKNPARVRHWIWVAASLKFLVPFSLLVALGGNVGWRTARVSTPSVFSVVAAQVSEPFLKPVVSPSPLPTAFRTNRLPLILSVAWAVGFAGIACAWWIRWRRITAVIRAGSPIELGLPVPAISSSSFLEPGVFGIFRPVLLLPEGIFDHLTPEQMKSVLAHELCHVRHRDNLVAVIQMFVETVIWFHPLVWWIGNRIFQERERACDEEVLRLGIRPGVYAQGILKVCELYLDSPFECIAGIAGGAYLRTRIDSILKYEAVVKLNLAKTFALIVAGIAAIAAPVVIGVWNAPPLLAQALPIPSDSAARSRFEVASIKPAASMPGNRNMNPRAGIPGRCLQKDTFDPGRVDIRCYSLGKLIWIWAFGIPPFRIVGPAWMGDAATDWSDGPAFDIFAKLPEGASRDQVPAMLRDLLITRFKLKTHREYREQPVYALVAKSGLSAPSASQNADALQAAANSQAGEPSNMNGVQFYVTRLPNPDGRGPEVWIMNSPRMGTVRKSETASPNSSERYEAASITLDGLADLLTIAGIGPEPVVNATGEQGRYQITLEISLAELEAVRSGPHDYADIQSAKLKAARDGLKKLGLQLERRKAPVEMLVIDNVEKTPTEN